MSTPPSPSTLHSSIAETLFSIASLTHRYLIIHPNNSSPILQIPPNETFCIPATPTNPFTKLIIPDGYNLLLYPCSPLPQYQPAPSPSAEHILTPENDSYPFETQKPYKAILSPTNHTTTTLTELETQLQSLQKQLTDSTNHFLYGLRTDTPATVVVASVLSSETLAIRLALPNNSTPPMPAFLLRAIAALGGLLPQPYTDASQRFARDLFTVTIDEGDATVSQVCDAFFDGSLDREHPIFNRAIFPESDPIRLALYILTQSIVDIEGSTDNTALGNEPAFTELFKILAKNAMIWHLTDSSSPSFAYTQELGTIRNYLIQNPNFQRSPFPLPVNVRTGFETVLDIGISPDDIAYLYPLHDAPAFLARQPDVVDALVAAVHFGADWDLITRPDELSLVRNTASYKMRTSSGLLYQGVYIDTPNAISDLLLFGNVAHVKLVDLSAADAPQSRALQDLAAAVDALRTFTKADAKTFKTRFGAILGDVRRCICRHVAEHGLVFKSKNRYMWIGCDDKGVMRLKKAVLFDGDLQSMPLPLPDMGTVVQVVDQPQPAGDDDGAGSSRFRLTQDMAFLVQDVEGIKLESTVEIRQYAGDIGILALLSAVRLGKVGLDSGFTHALITQRMPIRRIIDEGNMEYVKVNEAMKYAHLFVLEDNVVVDHIGQGWICGVDFLRGRNGAPGKIMFAETEGCAPMPIVEVEFSVPDTILVSS